jgi:hypothetical protein
MRNALPSGTQYAVRITQHTWMFMDDLKSYLTELNAKIARLMERL